MTAAGAVRLGPALAARGDAVLLLPGRDVAGAALAARVPGAALAPALGAGAALCLDDPAELIGALAALDGRAARLLLLAPGLPAAPVSELMAAAGLSALVSRREDLPGAIAPEAAFAEGSAPAPQETDWVLTTSGTTGTPKMVRHRLAGLARTVKPAPEGAAPVWGLVYEPTRFAGMQVVLQALLGGGRLAAAPEGTPISDRLAHFAASGVTHLSATPTLWRRILMDPAAAGLAPGQITLGGEIADDAVLGALARRFPEARIRHIYASTEAGVGFSVRDGRAGFPESYLAGAPGGAALKIRGERLWLRPPGMPPEPIGPGPARDPDGFIDSGDRVAVEDGRVRFLGRQSSAVNIGGAKIQPEEIERLVNAHPEVALARVAVRPSPITGALLTLSVVPVAAPEDPAALRRSLAAYCREHLPREARPAKITIAGPEALDEGITAAGKIVRAPAGGEA
ncbi:fatty acid--CoA ligase family protein [Paralimibaculum aggregatum]|uniref:Long-chain-fatty-acid--CoA ligase n=1 Tax=Paralimibaculum aggregatum TaxID=3036245 RepID=A0ABQ6LME2_9RHOB|nr:class I adenylate-forming enzyme family protein [Limibaculum sp. NKW23]GMG84363.1 fatty acid--CoA ligase family protein [Limibaculum sp. NKW23]